MTDEQNNSAMVLWQQPEPRPDARSQYNYGGAPGDVLPALLTVKQFCRLAGIGRTSAYLHMGKPDTLLEVAKLGSRTLITRASAEAFIQRSIIRNCVDDFGPTEGGQ